MALRTDGLGRGQGIAAVPNGTLELRKDCGRSAPPYVGRTVSDPAYQDPSGVEIDEEQDLEGFQAYRLDGKQVTSNDRYGLGPDELAPGVTLGPGLRFGAMTRRILDAEISMPSFSSSPWMRW
jgi:hypothetical protein